MRKKGIALCLCVLLMSVFLCGGIFFHSSVVMDTNTNSAYQNILADKLLTDFTVNFNRAENLYKNQKVMVLGKAQVTNGQIDLYALDNKNVKPIACTGSSQEAKDAMGKIKSGDLVKVYGKVTVALLQDVASISLDYVEKTEETNVVSTAWSTKSGTTVDQLNMYSRRLNGGKVVYSIPAAWKAVEHNLIEEDLGIMEGYQYRLNELDQKTVKPESFFVCYFDNSLLANYTDRDEVSAVEKAIANNILGKDVGTRVDRVNTFYGTRYDYYQAKYDGANDLGYHTEFIFQQQEKKGYVVYVYVYQDEPRHLDEIMILLRLLKVV